MIHWWLEARCGEFINRAMWAAIIAIAALIGLGVWKAGELIAGILLWF